MRLSLTRRGDYGVRAMLVLAAAPDARLSGAEIARRTQIPGRLAIPVMGDLVRAGLVVPRRGRHGGYVLARPATDIAMLEIVEAVEGDSRRVRCVLRGSSCSPWNACAVHDIFEQAQQALIARLGAATLASASGL